MMNRFNDPLDLASLKLECNCCGAIHKYVLKADAKLSEAKQDTLCKSCSGRGRFKLAK